MLSLSRLATHMRDWFEQILVHGRQSRPAPLRTRKSATYVFTSDDKKSIALTVGTRATRMIVRMVEVDDKLQGDFICDWVVSADLTVTR